MRTVVFAVFVVLIVFSASLGRAATPAETNSGSQKSLFLLGEGKRNIDRIEELRRRVERAGGRVRAVIGVAGIVADVPRVAAAGIASADARLFTSAAPIAGNAETTTALTAWNRLVTGELPAKKLPPRTDQPPTDVIDAPDLPRDPERLRANEEAYRVHWQQRRRTLSAALQRSASVGCANNGAGYYDTSLYFAGDVAVGVFFKAGSNGPWTPATAAISFGDLVQALDHFIDIQPNARLTFVYSDEVDSGGNPLPAPVNERTYVNDLRNTFCTDWTFMTTLQDGGVWPNAYLFGPSLRMDTTFMPFADVIRHEVGHMWGAGDSYAPAGPGSRYGYMMAGHWNACGTGGGFFGGAGECLDDLMAGWGVNFGYNSIIGPATAAQLGWLASAGNGALDLTNTRPVIDASTVTHAINASSWTATYNGVAIDRPPLNQQGSPYGDVSINRITAVQYRINNAPWQDAAPADGVYDGFMEGFNFMTPPLPTGTYTLEIRAINTVRAVTTTPYSEQLIVAGSNITNTRPFAALTVTPERAKFGTLITASAAASRDFESSTLTYSWKWDSSPWTAFASTATATHVYLTPGNYAVQVRVRDQGNLIHLLARNITVESYDTPPLLAFGVTPERRHSSGPSETVMLSVTGSSDAETPFAQLRTRWDVDCDGWDGPPSLQKTKVVTVTNSHYQRSDRHCVRAQLIDAANNTIEAVRFFWVVPYDHSPVVSGLTFIPAGSNYTLTVNATDADSTTSWDGILEYRFDFEGDGTWDTKFTSSPTINLPAAFRYTVAVQVRDRFDGRIVWLWCSPNFC
jgi:hypothetical protein